MQSVSIAKLLSYYANTDTSLHNARDASSYTMISAPSVKAYTTRAIQLGWLVPMVDITEQGYEVTQQGRDLIDWVKHGERHAYI